MKSLIFAVFAGASGLAVGGTNAFRVTPYVQHPSPTAMSILWLAQEGGAATLAYWADGSTLVTTLKAAARDDLAANVSGARFTADNALEYCRAGELAYDLSPEAADNNVASDGPAARGNAWSMPFTVPYQYRARLTGLRPGTLYRYRVTLDGAMYENRFRTPSDPAEGKGFRFVCYSDSETEPADNPDGTDGTGRTADWTDPKTDQNRRYPATQTEAYASNVCSVLSFGADLILMAGDLAQKGSRQRDWDEFWRHNAGPLNDPAGSVPILAAPGNHDYWSYADGGEAAMKKYLSYFEFEPNGAPVDADQQERFHRVDYGPVTFIFLDANNGDDSKTDPSHDTNHCFARTADGRRAWVPAADRVKNTGCRAPDFNPGSAQYRWLEAQLRDAREKSAFTFVVSHQCPFSVGDHGRPAAADESGELLSGRPLRQLLPLMHKYGVDGWFAGHDEMMERSETEGTETLADGTERPHKFFVWDLGIAGDGLRGKKKVDNPNERFRAHTDSPEVWENGRHVAGGKHYGHLEVTIDRTDDGRWRATFDPTYVFFSEDANGKSVYGGVRHYDDRQVRVSDRLQLKINEGRSVRFAHPLPRLHCGGRGCGTYNNRELAFPGFLNTTGPAFGDMLWHLRKVVWADRRLVFVDGRTLLCQNNWIRDHVHHLKGCCHWEHDVTSFLDFILDTQRADGQFYELVKQLDDDHWTYVNPDCRVIYPEDNLALVRLELEADVEYLMVEGCLQAWRVTGDDDWLKRALPRIERGIDYVTGDPKRWDAAHGLCKRPYTIDTWDFTNDPGSGCDRRIRTGEPMAAMHGDNTGVCQAMTQLAWINARFGRADKAAAWRSRAETLKANVMKHLWNGRFFVHQLPLNCPPLDGNETNRLSMSDAYALNRGILTSEQCRSVIDEYRARRKSGKAFAEWFTIDPPYGRFMKYPAGEYVNGAICPFTAGELAKGAFENGYEQYGWDILARLSKMVQEDDGRLYFLYSPKTRKPQGGGPSAWGAAAILSAVDQGLAGIQDLEKQYRKLRFAPRWAVTPFKEGRYLTGYERSGKRIDVRYVFTERGFRYHLDSPAEEVTAHLLVPPGKTPAKLLVGGRETPFALGDVFGSKYVDVTVSPQNGVADFEILY